jgi:LEA14-like dessication related protein
MQKQTQSNYSPYRYRKIVTALFAIGIISSGIGIVILASDFVQVYNTINQFAPQISRIEKSDLGDDDRGLVVDINVANPGSRSIFIEEYGFIIYLNEEYIISLIMFPDRTLEPNTNETLTISVDVTNALVQTILDAEISGEWNWEIRYPMRLCISWLYIVPQYYGTWEGVEEV